MYEELPIFHFLLLSSPQSEWGRLTQHSGYSLTRVISACEDENVNATDFHLPPQNDDENVNATYLANLSKKR